MIFNTLQRQLCLVQAAIFPGIQKANESTYFGKEFLCQLTDSVVGDGIDNDCDGVQDEDICYPEYGALREDQDSDGGFGEDCSYQITGVSNIDAPGDPNCAGKPIMPVIERPRQECWMPCQCDCAWVQQLEYRLSLSPEELEELNNAIIEEYQEDMTLDEEQLSSEMAKKQSADDDRQSSTTVGCAGVVFAAVVLVLIVGADAHTLFSYLCGRKSQPQPEPDTESAESSC